MPRSIFKRSNRTVGMYLPTTAPDRAPVPELPNIAKLIADYTGGPQIALGENFDPTPGATWKNAPSGSRCPTA